MTDQPTPDDFPTTGELPDKLAFVSENRARAYIALKRADDPLTAVDLADAIDCSEATAYRCVNDLQDLDLVREAVRFDAEYRQRTAYTTMEPPQDRTRDACYAGGATR
ncbi:helix-turn-helix domain-containing protein [Halopiger xanaduensis]|uniref:HTH iclR-type domain-containing protein n=1 Tax=Halopiger xanaduensis (strain DSM 18323 / JCM 14033 / SH-6) TaxID=797210 RepID=F8DEM8_HALXS|nr:helix-turn-helix domain-containing protein [Halopiger xanaduensis]AEH39465.1 hypothetical protein Halxa_0225 [Halopiger xanaduensis SH-6]